MTLGPKLYPCQIQVSIIFPWSRNHRQNASKMHRFQRLLVICVVGYMILKCLSCLTSYQTSDPFGLNKTLDASFGLNFGSNGATQIYLESLGGDPVDHHWNPFHKAT